MDSRTFTDIKGSELIVYSRRSAVFFELGYHDTKNIKYDFEFMYTSDQFNKFISYINDAAIKSWSNLEPKEANSISGDYFEYYDRELDNNGYLRIKGNSLRIERPSFDSTRLYKFNKKKMESFIFDLRKVTLLNQVNHEAKHLS